MQISKINNLNFEMLMRILSSPKITEAQKTQFVRQNKIQIETIMKVKISNTDFETLMQQRKLQKFRPLKNSFTKQGDKIILAKALGIKTNEIPTQIKSTIDSFNKINELDFLPQDKIEMLKTYVYRHGSKDELVAFLDYELKKSTDLTKTLYRTLEYYSGGAADYFIRPIHRMDNKTLIRIYNIINENIKISKKEGKMSDVQCKKIAKWALIKIYQIQNNSKLLNAIKTYNVLS